MKTNAKILFILCLLCQAGQCFVSAQQYSIGWHKIAGGGGASANGQFALNGTVGQADASSAQTNRTYSLTGGFWALVTVVPTPGAPTLLIQSLGANGLQISWPATGTYILQQSGSLASGNWTPSGYTVNTANGTNTVTITPSAGNLFFRLSGP